MANDVDFGKLLEVYTAVLISPKGVLVSHEKGVKPMMGWLKDSPDYLEGALLIDRVIGAAAANLAVLGKIKHIHAGLISENGIKVLEKYGIEYEYDNKTDEILNRDKSDLCPMEKLSKGVDDPKAIQQRIIEFFQSVNK